MKKTPLQQAQSELKELCATARVGDWFERYINHSRGLGNTNLLIKACVQNDVTLVFLTNDLAREIREDHPTLKVTDIGDFNFAQSPRKSMVDHGAMMALVRENRRFQMMSERLLTILSQKGIDK